MAHILRDMIFPLDLNAILLFTVLALVAVWAYSYKAKSTKKLRLPPYPVTPLPYFGHAFALGNDPRAKMKEWRQTCGNVFTLKFGSSVKIFVSGYELMKDLLVKNAEKVSGTPKSIVPVMLDEFNTGIIRASGPHWKENRTVSLSILKAFGVGKNILAERIQKEVDVFMEEIAKLKGEPYDFKLLTAVSTSNVISSIVFGKKFKHDDPEYKEFLDKSTGLTSRLCSLGLINNFPFLRYLPGDPFNLQMIHDLLKYMKTNFIQPKIEEAKIDLNMEKEPKNYIAAYLKEMYKRNETGGDKAILDERNLAVSVRNLYEAGTETSSTTITWFLYYMIHHPDIQQKIYDQIIHLVGTDRAPTIQDRPALTLLTATIMEILRIVSMVPMTHMRVVTSDGLQLDGYDLPKGAVVIPVLDSVLLDEGLWGDPDVFRPERFLDEQGQVCIPPYFIPFSMGRRLCIGESMAKMELYMFLSTLVHRFQILPSAPGELPPMTSKFGISTSPYPCKVRLVERSRTTN